MMLPVFLIAGLLTTGPLSAEQPPGAALRIVVIEGEGAVNIIQQKTAVAPVIEVRDRNDQPVAGATVNFIVRAGRATFGGARTLSVTTNAAGRAAAAGFAPSGTGALQIGATATFQGQAAAAVTIAQTNVLTAAEAAAVASGASSGAGGGSAAGGGGAGAGSGGGMSLTTIGIVGGAVAAGAVVANKTLLSGVTFAGQFSGLLLHATVDESGARGCTTNQSLTATLEITFDSMEEPVSGAMKVDDTNIRLSPGTCPPDSYNTGTDYFPSDSGSVTGSRDNLTGTGSHRNDYSSTNPPGGGVNAYDFTFTGRFDSDEQITGSLTVERTVTWRPAGGGSGSTSRGSVTSQVVLRKR
jgi:hypothetical protein